MKPAKVKLDKKQFRMKKHAKTIRKLLKNAKRKVSAKAIAGL